MPGSGNFQWFFEPVFNLFGRQISPAGIAAFVGCLVAGLLFSSFLQSGFMRRQLSRLGLDKNLVAILTASVSLVAFLGFVVLGLNLGGLPIPWEAKVPAIGLSLSQIFQLIALVAIVFWFASAAKRFLFNRFLSKSGLDRSLQYTIAQICGYLVLVIGVLVALQSAGLNLSALAVFAGAIGVGIGFGLQNITRNFISGLVVLAERPIKIGDRVEVGNVTGQVKEHPRPQHHHSDERQHSDHRAKLRLHRKAGDQLEPRRFAGALSHPGRHLDRQRHNEGPRDPDRDCARASGSASGARSRGSFSTNLAIPRSSWSWSSGASK